jgi:NIPSNAP
MPAMKRRTLLQAIPVAALIPATGWNVHSRENAELPGSSDSAKNSTTVYEMRVYHTYEGKLDDLQRRFREHTMALFEKHGIRNVAYWTPLDEPLKGKTLIYIISHPSREAAVANWKAFSDDPEWQSVRAKSEENGKLVEKVDSTFMALTDFSPKLT